MKLRHANKQITDLKISKEQLEEDLKEKERQYESQDLVRIVITRSMNFYIEGALSQNFAERVR